MRIIGGRWKRSKLPVLDAPGLRPTPDRVRETLFNWLGQDLSGWRCLDAFAGSGALGLEAASRGAAEVVMLEADKRLALHLKAIAGRLDGAQVVRVLQADALAWMRQAATAGERFDLVMLDPPFAADWFEPAWLLAASLLTPQGLIYLEADRAFSEEAWAGASLALYRQGRAGAVYYCLLRHAAC